MKSKTVLFLIVLITLFNTQSTHSAMFVDFIDNHPKPSSADFNRKTGVGLVWEHFIQTFGFGAVLHAYAEFERSGFMVVNHNLMADTYFVADTHHRVRNNNSWSESSRQRWEESPPFVMYTFFDINGNGTPDLLIGGNWGWGGEFPSLISIYTLQNGMPVPVIYESSHHVFLDFVEDIYGNNNIRTAGGRMGIMWDEFYTIDENGELLKLLGFYSWERHSLCTCCYLNDIWFTEFRKYYDDRFENGIMITEDEYNALLKRFGIYNNDNIGRIELNWKRLVE